jgi:hypothetical protein
MYPHTFQDLSWRGKRKTRVDDETCLLHLAGSRSESRPMSAGTPTLNTSTVLVPLENYHKMEMVFP